MADAKDPAALRVLVYSDDADTRSQVMLALGRQPHPDLPELEYLEVATADVVIEQMDSRRNRSGHPRRGGDPRGRTRNRQTAQGRARALPPLLVLTGRPDDEWLARWSRAEATATHPIDPIQLTDTVVGLLRGRPAA